jgi:hypothetical protein
MDMEEIKAKLLIIGSLSPEDVPASPYLLVEDEERVIVVSGGSFAEVCDGGLDAVNAQAVRKALRIANMTPVFISSARPLPDYDFLSSEMNQWSRNWWWDFVAELMERFEEPSSLSLAA